MSAVDEAVADGVRDGLVPDDAVPILGLELACDNGRRNSMSVVEHLQQFFSLRGTKYLEAEVVEDKDLHHGEPAQQVWVGPIRPGLSELGEEAGAPPVGDGEAISACLISQRAGEVAFPDAGGSREDDVLVARCPPRRR